MEEEEEEVDHMDYRQHGEVEEEDIREFDIGDTLWSMVAELDGRLDMDSDSQEVFLL